MNDEKIICLSDAEHIRRRPAMYVANVRNGKNIGDGIYSLLKEIVENSVDEFRAGFGTMIDVRLTADHFSLRDYGRGIPLDALETVCEKNFAGAKFHHDAYHNTIGLHGLGLKVVRHLSRRFQIRSVRLGHYRKLLYEQGKAMTETSGETRDADGCFIEAYPDPAIFGKTEMQPEIAKNILLSYLATAEGLKISFNENFLPPVYGLVNYLFCTVDAAKLKTPPIHFSSPEIDFALVFDDSIAGHWHSFVNGHLTGNGGVHVDAAKAALLEVSRSFWKDGQAGRTLSAAETFEGVVAAIAIQIENPVFEAQTKNRLGNVELFLKIKTFLSEQLKKFWLAHPDDCDEFFTRIDRIRERKQKQKELLQSDAKATPRYFADQAL